MKENDNFDKIEAYLNGELTLGEQELFEAEILADSSLAAEVDAHTAMRLATRRLGERQLQAGLKEMLADLDGAQDLDDGKNKPANNPDWFRWISLVLALALCATLWKLFSPASVRTQEAIPADTQSSLHDTYIDSLTTEFKAIKATLDSVVKMKNQSGDAPVAPGVMMEIRQLRLRLEEKDRQIRLLQQERNRPLGPREIALMCLPVKKISDQSVTKRATGQVQDKLFDAAAAAFDQQRYAEVERLLFPNSPPFIMRPDTLIFTDSTQLDVNRLELMGHTFMMLDQIPQALACFEEQKRIDPFERGKADWNIFRCQATQPQKYRASIRRYIDTGQAVLDSSRKQEMELLLEAFRINGIRF